MQHKDLNNITKRVLATQSPLFLRSLSMQEHMTTEHLESQIKYVSHEIRNHLSICDMYTQIIKRNLEKDNITNPSIENAIGCIQKSLQIIGTNLMDLKSINNNQIKIYDFKTIVEKSIELSKAYIDEKGIEFEIFIKNTANIKTDENRYLSCIVNIIKNGIEAIEIAGKITIIGEIKDNYATLKISNNGKSIPPDKQEKIFEIGYTSKNTGSGLGLGICKKYLKEIGGDIQLNKSTKTETQFEILIPTC